MSIECVQPNIFNSQPYLCIIMFFTTFILYIRGRNLSTNDWYFCTTRVTQTSDKTEVRARQKLKMDTKVFKCNNIRNASSVTCFRPKNYLNSLNTMREMFSKLNWLSYIYWAIDTFSGFIKKIDSLYWLVWIKFSYKANEII